MKKPALTDRSAGKTPLPSAVTRRLAFTDKHVAANGIVQAFDAGLEREDDRADHRAEEDLQRRGAREHLRFVELDADRRQRRHFTSSNTFSSMTATGRSSR